MNINKATKLVKKVGKALQVPESRLQHSNPNIRIATHAGEEPLLKLVQSPQMRLRWKEAYPGHTELWYDKQIANRVKAYEDAYNNITYADEIDDAFTNGKSVIGIKTKPIFDYSDLVGKEHAAYMNGKRVLRRIIGNKKGIILRKDLNDTAAKQTGLHEVIHQSTSNMAGRLDGDGTSFYFNNEHPINFFSELRPVTEAAVVDNNIKLITPVNKDKTWYGKIISKDNNNEMNLVRELFVDAYKLATGLDRQAAYKRLAKTMDDGNYYNAETEIQSRGGVGLLNDMNDININDEAQILNRLNEIDLGIRPGSKNIIELLRYRTPEELTPYFRHMLLGGLPLIGLVSLGVSNNTLLAKRGGKLIKKK